MLSALVATIMAMPKLDIERGVWMTDFEKAKRYARASDRTVVVNFTGSDWCPYCLRLKKEVFDTDQFKDWADDHAILVEADFPRGKELPKELVQQNEWLSSEYSVGGYPTILFLNGNGEYLGRSGYLQKPGPNYWTDYADVQIANGKERLKESNGYPDVLSKRMVMKDYRGKELPSWEFGECANGSLPDLKGKTIVIDFWATWCSPCLAEMPKLQRWSEELGDDFVLIGVTDEPIDKVKRFASRYGITYPLVSDEDHKLQSLFEVQALPAMVLVSSDGIVRWQGQQGDGDPLTSMKIRRMIEATK